MWTLGNELNLFANKAPQMPLIQTINGYMEFARNYTLSRWGRKIPITSPVVDNPSSYPSLWNFLGIFKRFFCSNSMKMWIFLLLMLDIVVFPLQICGVVS